MDYNFCYLGRFCKQKSGLFHCAIKGAICQIRVTLCNYPAWHSLNSRFAHGQRWLTCLCVSANLSLGFSKKWPYSITQKIHWPWWTQTEIELAHAFANLFIWRLQGFHFSLLLVFASHISVQGLVYASILLLPTSFLHNYGLANWFDHFRDSATCKGFQIDMSKLCDFSSFCHLFRFKPILLMCLSSLDPTSSKCTRYYTDVVFARRPTFILQRFRKLS